MTSAGYPFFSYIARKKNGSMTAIMMSDAGVVPSLLLEAKKSGTPIRTAVPKHRSWRAVRFRKTLLLTRDRLRGTFAYRFSI
jgi:hypothetical protein